tara:strand:+ start:817 stop:1590 length:774 start_codon:yes stop_codon:yes gene_type:complete
MLKLWPAGFLLVFNVIHDASNMPPFQLPEFMEGMAYIEGGVYERGCGQFGPEHGAPRHRVRLREFMIDKREVTNREYEKLFPDHRYRRSQISFCDDCPVTKVTWYNAAEYCYVTGKALPTEAQWEKAAGGKDGCEFPWGPDFDQEKRPARGGFKLKDGASPVGSFPPNKHGIYDMGGNVWEWVSDWYFPYPNVDDHVLFEPRGPSRGQVKVRRGGSWSDTINSMATGYRDWSYPYSRSMNDIGFRCALTLKSNGKPN